jgi:hypothetical protein
MKPLFFAPGILFAAIAAGCASPEVAERQESSTAAIRAAEEVGATRIPRASLHLQLAKEESEEAKGLIAKGDKDRAMSLLLRAEADADLAVVLAREQSERAQAEQAQAQVRQLQQDNP